MTGMVIAKIDGNGYNIPRWWMVGAAKSLGGYENAIRHWHHQAQMERKEQDEKISPTT